MSVQPVTIGNATLYHGDCLEILPTLPKVDAVITDDMKYRQRTCAECACDFTPTNAAQKFCVEHTRSKRLRNAAPAAPPKARTRGPSSLSGGRGGA